MAATKSTGTRNSLVWYWNEQYVDVLALAFWNLLVILRLFIMTFAISATYSLSLYSGYWFVATGNFKPLRSIYSSKNIKLSKLIYNVHYIFFQVEFRWLKAGFHHLRYYNTSTGYLSYNIYPNYAFSYDLPCVTYPPMIFYRYCVACFPIRMYQQ
jgi:hypothetical protein